MVAGEARKPLEQILRYAIVFLAVVFLVELVLLSLPSGIWNGGTGSDPVLESDASPAELLSLPPLEDFKELVDRSLFAWNRQPIKSDKKVGDQEEVDIAEWHLSGIVNHPGRDHLAIFVAEEGGGSLALKKGMYLGDWEIERIDEDSVIFVEGGNEHVMRLKTVDVELPKNGNDRRGEKTGQEVGDETSEGANGESGGEKAGDGELTPLQEDLRKVSDK